MNSWSYTVILGLASILANSHELKLELNPELQNEIDNFIQNVFLPLNGNTSLALAITTNESVLYSTGYGLQNVESEIPATNETEYLIGSISKSFAALIVVRTLHETYPELEIEVALNTPIRKLAPSLNFTLGDRFRSEQATFRDLLSHRICTMPNGLATLTAPFQSAQEVGYRQRYAPEACPFRTFRMYNNGMYALIASSIENIAGKPYGILLTELLRDIGMHNTTFVKKEDDDEFPNRAIPYYLKDGERHRNNPKLMKRVAIGTAAGGIVSNALGMAKYIQFYLNKGKVGDRQVLPEAAFESMYRIAVTESNDYRFKPDSLDFYVGYSLGLLVGVYDGWLRIGHGGSVPPFLTEMNIYPALNLGIYTSTNQSPASQEISHSQLHNAIFDILGGQSPTLRKSPQPLSNNKLDKILQKDVPTESSRKVQNDDLIGSYGNGLQGELDIMLKFWSETNSTELYMNWGEWGKAYLTETSTPLRFRVNWDTDIIQDSYSMGIEFNYFVAFNENGTTMNFIEQDTVAGTFQKGVYLGGLPPVPWSADSCGPAA